MERLRLPSPASYVWARTGAIVRDRFEQPDDPDPGFAIGGGTILAARWHHRQSDDIDVKVTAGGRLQRILTDPTALAKLDADLRQEGFLPQPRTSALQAVYTRGTEPNAPALDLFESELRPREPTHWALIRGKPTAVASNRQILSGKTQGRSATAPVRDLFDLGVATEEDPRAAEAAINAVTAHELSALPVLWDTRAESYRTEASTDLKRVPERYAGIQDEPAATATRAIRELTWRQIDIAYTPQGAIITGYRPGEERPLHHDYLTTPAAIEDALEAIGVRWGRNPATRLPWPTERMLAAQRTGSFDVAEIKDSNFIDEPPHRPALLDPKRREAKWKSTPPAWPPQPRETVPVHTRSGKAFGC